MLASPITQLQDNNDQYKQNIRSYYIIIWFNTERSWVQVLIMLITSPWECTLHIFLRPPTPWKKPINLQIGATRLAGFRFPFTKLGMVLEKMPGTLFTTATTPPITFSIVDGSHADLALYKWQIGKIRAFYISMDGTSNSGNTSNYIACLRYCS